VHNCFLFPNAFLVPPHRKETSLLKNNSKIFRILRIETETHKQFRTAHPLAGPTLENDEKPKPSSKGHGGAAAGETPNTRQKPNYEAVPVMNALGSQATQLE
jgi:hypothetical protein